MSGTVEFDCDGLHHNWRGTTPCPYCLEEQNTKLKAENNQLVESLAACSSLAKNGVLPSWTNPEYTTPALFDVRKLVQDRDALRSAMERYRQEREEWFKEVGEYRKLLRRWLDPQLNYADLDQVQKDSEELLHRRNNRMKLVNHNEE
jgi:hypothetical protein